jgi:hypothetical protein
MFDFFYKNNLLKHSMNPSIIQITKNTQLKSNHLMYPFDLQIIMGIQFQLNYLMYPSNEKH